MRVQAHCAASFRDANGKEYTIPKGYAGEIPAWVQETALFRGLIRGRMLAVLEYDKSLDTTACDTKKGSKNGKKR